MLPGRAPGEVVRILLEHRGWTQDEFAAVIGRSKRTVNDIILGRTGISPDTAIALGAACGNDAREWMAFESEYRLSLAKQDAAEVEERARLFAAAPIRDMQRRGWIGAATSADE